MDTHPIHFHLFDVQVINRVGWDGFIRLPDPNELGWKDTVRMSPLEDTIVALRPITPVTPFPLPDSIRPMNPMAPIGSMMGFSQTDPLTGNAVATPVENAIANYGWEYVWHCHILSHEENDMMRAIVFSVAPPAPTELFAAAQVAPDGVNLTWTDNAASETGFTLQRSLDPAFPDAGTTTFDLPPSAPATTYGATVSYLDTTAVPLSYYRVQAYSPNGVSAWSNIASADVLLPIASVTPATLAIGNQVLNTTSVAQLVTLSNNGTADLSITSVGVTGANAADFAQTNDCGATLVAGNFCTFSVTFTPQALGGRFASLAIGSNDPVHPLLSVGLSGSGTGPVASVSPASLTFADQLINTQSAARVITLTNIGNVTLVFAAVTPFSITGTNPGDFLQTTTCGASLAPAASCTISVQFLPTAAGARAATLEIATTSQVSPLPVPLAGNCTAPLAGVSPASLNFGSQVVSSPTSLAVVLSKHRHRGAVDQQHLDCRHERHRLHALEQLRGEPFAAERHLYDHRHVHAHPFRQSGRLARHR